ncbi:MAG: SDR family NAD(P)-dependent oxidoreductase, partial [Pirellulales bacterium]|nr:SDR family NAD(P)-dependent oxidoreductase [Pirellulales bacterium]
MTEAVKENCPEGSTSDQNIPKILKGQKALVTGANSGIGKGVALALGQAGAEVMVNYVSHQDAAEEVAHTISGYGSRSSTFHC